MEELSSLSTGDLRKRCEALGVSTVGLLEKSEIVAALHRAEVAAEAEAEAEEEEALRQAMLMSEEDADGLAALSVSELRQRCAARSISTVGLAEKADLVSVLLNGAEAVTPAAAAAESAEAAPAASENLGAALIGRFAETFHLRAADESLLDPSGGKVMLPHSCLTALAIALGGELPPTLLLRLTHRECSVCVGVADFVDDQAVLSALQLPAGERTPTWGPGALAAVLVPRWVRGALCCADGDGVHLSVVSLPQATGLVLQPQTERFAAAVLAAGTDPRAALTATLNRITAVQPGDCLSLRIGDERHAVDVLAVRGLPRMRCGQPRGFGAPAATLDVGAALRAVGATGGPALPQRGVLVRAACIVDADVEVDFAPSCEAEGTEARAKAAAAAAAVERAAAVEAARRDEAARADRWSSVNAGEGRVLGAAGGDPGARGEGLGDGLSERDKRLAALSRRGLG